jgi:hypothetical protein
MRAFELSGNRSFGAAARASWYQSRLTWERVFDLPKLSAYQRQLIGF